MFFVCALVLTFLIKLRFPKGISIASVLEVCDAANNLSPRDFNYVRKKFTDIS